MTAALTLAPHAAIMTVASAAGSSQKCSVVLFDVCTLELCVHPSMYAGDILDMVAVHIGLTEKQYFGLYFLDDVNRRSWLSLDRLLLEHDVPVVTASNSWRKADLQLYFDVRYYAESVLCLNEGVTLELFFHSAREAVYEGRVECDSETAFRLAGHALQATAGDHANDSSAVSSIRRTRLLSPAMIHREGLSADYCEQRILAFYSTLRGQTRGDSIVRYMNAVEKLPAYGIAYYRVTDKLGLAWWLGLGCQGLTLADGCDRTSLQRVFPWKHLENLYFRDKKFTIEIHDPKRVVHVLSSCNPYENAIQEAGTEFDDLSDALCQPTTQDQSSERVSVSSRMFGPRNTSVYAWFTADPKLTKAIWTEAVRQHQFYLEARHNTVLQYKTMSEVAARVPAAPVLPPTDSQAISAHSIKAAAAAPRSGSADVTVTQQPAPATKPSVAPPSATPGLDNYIEKQAKHRRKLSQRRDELRAALKAALHDLRDICLHEAALTGRLPPEYPSAPGEQPPPVPRRVRTAFTISVSDGKGSDSTKDEQLTKKLEIQYELQQQIARATLKLVNDASLPGAVRKKHRGAYDRLCAQLKNLEAERQRAVQHVTASGSADISSLSSGFSEDVGADTNDDLKSLSLHSSPLSSHHSSLAVLSASSQFSKVGSSSQHFLPEDQGQGQGRSAGSSTPPPPLLPRLSSASVSSSASNTSSRTNRQRHVSGGSAAERSKNAVAEPSGKPKTFAMSSSVTTEVRGQSPVPQPAPRGLVAKFLAGGGCHAKPSQSLSASLLSHQLHTLRDEGSRVTPPPRPARSGSCDDLRLAENSFPQCREKGVSSVRHVRSKELLCTNNPYGSLERRKPRGDRHAQAAICSEEASAPPLAERLRKPAAPRAHEGLSRVQSSPLPPQQAEQAATRRRRQSEVDRDGQGQGPAVAAAAVLNDGRRTPASLASQSSGEVLCEPVPPLAPRASRHTSGGTSSAVGQSLSTAGHRREAPMARSLTPSPAPIVSDDLYDAYVLRLSKASQRLYETGTPPPSGPLGGQQKVGRQAAAVPLPTDQPGSGGFVHHGHRAKYGHPIASQPLADPHCSGSWGSSHSRSGLPHTHSQELGRPAQLKAEPVGSHARNVGHGPSTGWPLGAASSWSSASAPAPCAPARPSESRQGCETGQPRGGQHAATMAGRRVGYECSTIPNDNREHRHANMVHRRSTDGQKSVNSLPADQAVCQSVERMSEQSPAETSPFVFGRYLPPTAVDAASDVRLVSTRFSGTVDNADSTARNPVYVHDGLTWRGRNVEPVPPNASGNASTGVPQVSTLV